MKYSCIVIDPPWPQRMTGNFKRARDGFNRTLKLPYKTMSLEDIAAMGLADRAGDGAHCWLWTTNSHLADSFNILAGWGFTYLNTVTWVKPSGLGAWFANTTQHCLFGYYKKCQFPLARWRPTHFNAVVKPGEHSRKPDAFYDLVRSISPGPRLDMFARRVIEGFDGWGDEYPVSDARI